MRLNGVSDPATAKLGGLFLLDSFPIAFLFKSEGAEIEHKLSEHKLVSLIIDVNRTFFIKIIENENVHEMARRASKMDFSYTKMNSFSRLSSW